MKGGDWVLCDGAMPHYFIDSSDGDLQIVDHEGLALPDDRSAREAALAALPDMAHDKIPDGDTRVISVSVRNDRGQTIYSARLELTGQWHAVPLS